VGSEQEGYADSNRQPGIGEQCLCAMENEYLLEGKRRRGRL